MAKTTKKSNRVSSASTPKTTAKKAVEKKVTTPKATVKKATVPKAVAQKPLSAVANFERLNVRIPSSEKAKMQKIVGNLGTSNSKYALACFKSRWEQESGKTGKIKHEAPLKAKKAKKITIKDNHIEFHFSPDEKKKIVKAAKRAGMGASQYVRETLFE